MAGVNRKLDYCVVVAPPPEREPPVPVVAPDAPALVLVAPPPGAELPDEAPELPVPAPALSAALEEPLWLSQAQSANVASSVRRECWEVLWVHAHWGFARVFLHGHAGSP
jgi:hypothetical protein